MVDLTLRLRRRGEALWDEIETRQGRHDESCNTNTCEFRAMDEETEIRQGRPSRGA